MKIITHNLKELVKNKLQNEINDYTFIFVDHVIDCFDSNSTSNKYTFLMVSAEN